MNAITESALTHIRFVLEEFVVESPSQQLLDRFLFGYPTDAGAVHKRPGCEIGVHVVSGGLPQEPRERRRRAGLRQYSELREMLEGCRAAVVVPRGEGAQPNPTLVHRVLELLPSGSRCFVHGVLGLTTQDAAALAAMALKRDVNLRSGTSIATTWRLPAISPPVGASLRQGLIVVQGAAPLAEMMGLEGLATWSELRRRSDSSVTSVRRLKGAEVWRELDDQPSTTALLASALSRTDSPLGWAIEDGRTQNLMLPEGARTMAKDPRGWVVEDADGFRSTVLVLDGVVRDINVAVSDAVGQIWSAQIFRPLSPQQSHYNRFAEAIELFLSTGSCGSLQRSLRIASILAAM